MFKGHEWKGRFPVLTVQRIDIGFGPGIAIDGKVLNELEKEVKKIFRHSALKLQRIQSRSTLIGNRKAGEIDIEFIFNNQLFQMKSFLLEGSTSFLLSYIAAEEDFNTSANQAVQAIRSFKQKH